MYGDEFIEKTKKLYLSDTPLNNRDRCNPLFRIHKSEWIHDKIDRSTKHIHQEQNKPKTPIHEHEAKIKLIKQLQESKEVIK